jgi:hypothetical protein
MIYLIIGIICVLFGMWLIHASYNFIGIISIMIGISLGLKGRQQIDKNRKV